ncbi:MAG: two-component system, chemotaxis family, sensor kinase CheA [Eubacteriales bacterium]|nr:two-component system, chemotaxis family, sensor kinase CheA [Eubacteriales bacterium]MDN5364711.1 two-component system, chemotaxis family, sensor kinase CheA [Eubacteriales bacterium]
MGLNLDASPEELKLFLEEVEEHLQVIEEDLVRLEKEEGTEELLQEIFRAAHTLKGSSATIGHKRMAELTHAMESVLDKLRKKQLSVRSDVIDLLFEALDNLRVLKDEIVNDEESDIDLSGIVSRLQNVREEEAGPPGVTAEGANSDATGGEKWIEVNWEEIERIKAEEQAGRHLLQVHILFRPEGEMLPVRAFIVMMSLRELGNVIKSEPTEEQIEKEEMGTELKVLLATGKDAAAVEKRVKELPDIADVKVVPFSLQSEEKTADKEGEAALQPAAAEKNEEKDGGGSGEVKKKGGGSNGRIRSGRTVRVDVELLDDLMNLVGELVIDRTRLFRIASTLEATGQLDEVAQDLSRTSVHIGRVTSQLQEQIMKARMLPVESLFNKFPRMVRDLAQKAGKEVDFVMEGQETELDRSIIEEIGDPLIHLLRNAVDHGIETPEEREKAGKPRKGRVLLKAYHEENHIIITVSDDGKGIDVEKVKESAVKKGLISPEHAARMSEKEALNLIFASGLSTAQKVTDVSGRGVGMDVVRTNIEKINGTIEINTVPGQGTEFRLKLPLTLAIIRALLVSLGNNVYAIPLSSVDETLRLNWDAVEKVSNKEVIVVRGRVLPLLKLDEVFSLKIGAQKREKIFVVVVSVGGEQMGIVVDRLVGEQEIVIKSLGNYIGDVPGISGATILGDGSVALILDVPSLLKKAVP